MNPSLRYSLQVIRLHVDFLVLALSWVLSYYLRFYCGLPVSKGIPDWTLYLKMIPFIFAIWFILFTNLGLYRKIGFFQTKAEENLKIIQGCVLGVLGFIVFTFFYEEYRYSRATLMIFFLLDVVLLIWGRSMIRRGSRYYFNRLPKKEYLLIGTGEALEYAYKKYPSVDAFQTKITGLISTGQNRDLQIRDQEFAQEKNIPYFPFPALWEDFFAAHTYAGVILGLGKEENHFFVEHLEKIAQQVLDIKLLPNFSNYHQYFAKMEIMDQTPVISIHVSPLEEGLGRFVKRMEDIIGATIALLLFAPIMLLVAILVKCSSKGPIFYKQERMGIDGRIFQILKFRSMPITSEEKTGPVWANKTDNRATPLGKFIRKSSLDELPQLINVLRGEMSLVGPRPERPIFVGQFRRRVPGYMLRHMVKAGITGWAQVNGWRGNTSIEKRIEYDLYYIQNWSFLFDIKILFLTIFKGFIDPNAY